MASKQKKLTEMAKSRAIHAIEIVTGDVDKVTAAVGILAEIHEGIIEAMRSDEGATPLQVVQACNKVIACFRALGIHHQVEKYSPATPASELPRCPHCRETLALLRGYPVAFCESCFKCTHAVSHYHADHPGGTLSVVCQTCSHTQLVSPEPYSPTEPT